MRAGGLAGLVWAASIVVVASAATAAGAQDRSELAPIERALQAAASVTVGMDVPAPEAFRPGNQEIAAGTTQSGPFAVAGTLRIAGTLSGNGYSYGGDIVVLPGARVTGSLVAIGGRVVLEGGDVAGEMRSIGGELAPVAAPSVGATTTQSLLLTLGWAGVVLIVGIGVLVFGGRTLDVVGTAAGEHFGKSFLVGVGATLAMAPVLGLGIIGLALTILGVLLIPFAVVAYVLAVVGLVALGFLAAMCMTGRALQRTTTRLSERGAALRALLVGLVFFVGIWMLAALATPWPIVASAGRVIAFALTWAAATVGLGATILTRAGTRSVDGTAGTSRVRASLEQANAALADTPAAAEWLTPTPVSGVVAARRPSGTVVRER